MGFKSALRERALREGFSDIRICRPDAAPELADRLAAFLKAGFHGQMRWMSERTAWRADPRALWPEIKSVVMLAENYAPRTDAMRMLARKECGNISVYARNRDYHELVKKRAAEATDRREAE
ncbi:MAG: epoxyqueuosine reductase, partial [Paracoccaceae bacterium]